MCRFFKKEVANHQMMKQPGGDLEAQRVLQNKNMNRRVAVDAALISRRSANPRPDTTGNRRPLWR